MGVTKVGNKKYRARYSENGRRVNVGTFNSHKEAQEALDRHQNLGGLQYEEIPVDEPLFRVSKPTLKERVKTWLLLVKENLEKRNLL